MVGQLIVFEGIDGCGKTTQLRRLEQWLNQDVWPLEALPSPPSILLTKEPGATRLGAALRQLLLTPNESEAMEPTAELLLYAADRAQHVSRQLKPMLAEGAWVLCDRYEGSTWAYQGMGRGLELSLIEQLNHIATGGLQADLTLWLDLSPAQTQRRLQRRGEADRLEQADAAFHQRVRQGFAQLTEGQGDRWVRIDADGDEEVVAQRVQQAVRQWSSRVEDL